ncbi:MAG TPA: protease inhibitor I42 family protein [Caldisericia bacterium]|nr:protease inhibitor I42 family protein [Caldisericia bacterium]
MKKYFVMVLLIALVGTASACMKPKALEDDMPKEEVTVETKVVEIQLGQNLEIVLEGNATTGYLWSFSSEFDPLMMEFVEQKTLRDESKDIVGSPENNIWIFKAIKAGQANATLVYKRPWEENVEPLKTMNYQVTILP